MRTSFFPKQIGERFYVKRQYYKTPFHLDLLFELTSYNFN